MMMHLDNAAPFAGTRRMLIGIAAVAGLVCGASGGGALAQGQRTRPAPSAPPVAATPPVAPTPPTPPPAAPSPLVKLLYGAGAGTGGGGPATYVFKSSDNGREIELRLRDNEVVLAKIDGEEVPADRVERDGDTVRFKDAKGEVVFEHEVSHPHSAHARGAMTLSRAHGFAADPGKGFATWRRAGGAGGAGQGGAGAWARIAPGPDGEALVEMEPPNVMLGVTMIEPDASLRGHLGLEPGTTTLVGAVYEGLPADSAGLEPYDIIIALNGGKPADNETIRKALREMNPGDEMRLTVIHRGKEREATIKLEKYDKARFNETKVRAISAVEDGDPFAYAEALRLYGQRLGDVVGVAPDPNNPGATLFGAAELSSQDLHRFLTEAKVKIETETARAHEALSERLGAKAAESKDLEVRMRRMEALLEKLLEQREGGKP